MASHQAKIWAVVPAAGIGSRMGQSTPKQYLKLNDQYILEITLSKLLQHKELAGAVVSIAENDDYWRTLAVAKLPSLESVIGGATRAHSVLHGLKHLTEKADAEDWVLVHDAARPCLSAESLNRLIDSLDGDPVGGVLAVPARDTLKRVAEQGGHIELTLDRSKIWHAQTPQMFRFGLLKSALESAIEKQQDITDEASAMESAGYQVKLVPGDAMNIKITCQEDLRIAELLMGVRG